MPHLYVSVDSDTKDLFQIKLIQDGIKTQQAFLIYFLKKYNQGLLMDDQLAMIKKYQEKNPAKVEDSYCKVVTDGELHKDIMVKKITEDIKPQYLCRFFIQEYLSNQISAEIIADIKSKTQSKNESRE